MFYLAELLVVMTDRLKIVRIHAQNVRRVQHKRFDDDASLSHSLKATALCSRCAGVLSCWNTKNSSWDNAHVWQWPL